MGIGREGTGPKGAWATHMTTAATRVRVWGAGASPKRLTRGACSAMRSPCLPLLLGRTGGTGLAVLEPVTPSGGPVHSRPCRRRHDMQDVLYIGLTLGFLALSWGLVVLCDRL
jgi:hypothetical protein